MDTSVILDLVRSVVFSQAGLTFLGSLVGAVAVFVYDNYIDRRIVLEVAVEALKIAREHSSDTFDVFLDVAKNKLKERLGREPKASELKTLSNFEEEVKNE